MDEKLREAVKERLARKESPARLRAGLLDEGYAEHDVDAVMKSLVEEHLTKQSGADRQNNRLLIARELLDRIGYGAASPQFINILFYQTGAGLFLLGLMNGLKSVLSLLIASVAREYAKVHKVSKRFIVGAGVLFGFSFLIMAAALRFRHVWLFALGILLAAIGVVTYGDLYQKLVSETLRREKRGRLLVKMGQYGILITVVSMLVSGWLIDRFPETSSVVFHLWGFTFKPLGYLLSFLATAFAFIISGYLLSLLKDHREERRYELRRFLGEHYRFLLSVTKRFTTHRYIPLLLAATMISGLFEVLGQSYYGLFIYQQFRHVWLGGFLNVAVIYSFAILASFSGPWFTTRLKTSIGLSPMLVFGTLLIAILPFTLVYNARFFAVALALICSVIGAVIVGFAQGLLVRKLLDEQTRKEYFMSLGLLVSVPYLLLVPVGAWIAQAFSLTTLFLIVGLGLAVVVAPLYFILVAMANKERL